MRRLLVHLMLLSTLTAVVAVPATAKTAFFIRGGGWGHGIGMSQWGAYGFAVQGGTYREILRFYYPGTTRGSVGNPIVHVTLASGRTSLAIGSDAYFYAADSNGKHKIGAGVKKLGADLKITTRSGRRITLTSPVTFSGSTEFIALNGTRYRRTVVVSKSGGRLSAVNRVRLESYLRGVVPNEAIPTWPAPALKAQAVAARSYALAVGGLTTTTTSQVYRGVDSEKPATDAAVAATAGEVRKYGGSVADTFFFSTSGGRTSTKDDAWHSGNLPYLKSVDDSKYDRFSPRYRWASASVDPQCHHSRYRGTGIADRVSVPSGFYDVVVARNGSGRAADVDLIGTSSTSSVPGDDFASAFHLCSTRFWVGVLGLRASKNRVAPGTKVTLLGFARREGTTLAVEQRPAGGTWQAAGHVGVAPNHHFEIVTRPNSTTSYRVRSGADLGPVITVTVS